MGMLTNTEIECPRHEAPQYGRLEFNGYIPGLRVHYYCNSGYKLVGLTYRTCGYDGVWSGELPTCTRKLYISVVSNKKLIKLILLNTQTEASRCSNLPELEYGSVNIPDYSPGSRAHYTCDHGYKLVGEAYRTCQEDCEWYGEPPRCIRKYKTIINIKQRKSIIMYA